MKKALFILALFSLLTACASSYPLGMSEEQWKSISPQERQALLLKQQKYNEEQRVIRMKAAAKERELQLKRDIAEKKRLDALYNNPENGNVIMVNILGGDYKSGKRHYNIMEDTYQIARGEAKQIELRLEESKKHYNSNETAYLVYAQHGNGVYLYLDNPKYSSSKRISLLRDGHWACGSNYKKSLYSSSYESLDNIRLFVKESASHCRTQRRHYL
ncbi:hypothetical protein [Thiomicrorhabdus sp. Milos-T2]|uniref:hypothetical protein n=1 Tax=Thiomicrorhabdus sp. Milos-T2 TaxID=90814 RepID=UPI00049417F4|nr:hypothetical protein [Thiomicrorhabdus sp. Milos-T2]